jgi:hypothetical protein
MPLQKREVTLPLIVPEQTHLAPSDWTSPVSSDARLNGALTNQAVNSIAR